MRPRSHPSSSSTNSMASASSSNSSTSCSSSKRASGKCRCASFLMPETFDLINPSDANIQKLECNRRNSSWDEYLYQSALEKWGGEEDRQHLRKELLDQMKEYYGNERWRNVKTVEDVEICDNEERHNWYLDSLVLYGDYNKKRCRYVDRQNHEAAKKNLRRRRLSTGKDERESPLRALLHKLAIS